MGLIANDVSIVSWQRHYKHADDEIAYSYRSVAITELTDSVSDLRSG